MILERLGISVWITDSKGEALPEYKVGQTDAQTIECWIPSSEGANFKIRWKAFKDSQPGLDLMCYPYLDGVELYGYCLYEDDIAGEEFGETYYHGINSSAGRLYQFGRRELTDKEDTILVNNFAQENLNTIRAELVWGYAENFRPVREDEYQPIENVGLLNEKQAKKGHAGSAELGASIEFKEPEDTFDFTPKSDMTASVFIFHYAPRDWLLARGVVTRPRSESPGPLPRTGQKRPRENTPEIIDIDGDETDEDDIVFVGRWIPASTVSNPKRRKNAGVKVEEVVEEPGVKVEDGIATPGIKAENHEVIEAKTEN